MVVAGRRRISLVGTGLTEIKKRDLRTGPVSGKIFVIDNYDL